LCLRAEVRRRGRRRTCIWWPYSCGGRSISAAHRRGAGGCPYLESDLAQVAQSPHKRRHGGVVCRVVVMLVRRSASTSPRGLAQLGIARQHPCSPETTKTSGDGIRSQHQSVPIPSMIIQGLIRSQAPRAAARRSLRVFNSPARVARRRYSTANAPAMAPAPQSQASMLATITTDLDKIAPRFEVQPEQITIIRTPAEFYETLKVGSLCSHVSIRRTT
jgi:hypothetical protein